MPGFPSYRCSSSSGSLAILAKDPPVTALQYHHKPGVKVSRRQGQEVQRMLLAMHTTRSGIAVILWCLGGREVWVVRIFGSIAIHLKRADFHRRNRKSYL